MLNPDATIEDFIHDMESELLNRGLSYSLVNETISRCRNKWAVKLDNGTFDPISEIDEIIEILNEEF